MNRLVERIVLLTVFLVCLAASSCTFSGGTYVGYGYGPGYGSDYYGDVFYSSPMDNYGYGFYGHP
jgi:hypothetical protein